MLTENTMTKTAHCSFDKWNLSWRVKDYHSPATPADGRDKKQCQIDKVIQKCKYPWRKNTPRQCVSVTHNSFITKITTNKWISALPSLRSLKKCFCESFERSGRVYWQYINNILSAIKHFSNTWLLSGKYSAGASSNCRLCKMLMI